MGERDLKYCCFLPSLESQSSGSPKFFSISSLCASMATKQVWLVSAVGAQKKSSTRADFSIAASDHIRQLSQRQR